MTVMVKVEGAEQLQYQFEQLANKMQASIAGNAIKQAVETIVLPDAKRRCPVLSGNLRDSLHVAKASNRKIGYAVVAGRVDRLSGVNIVKVFYGNAVELGYSRGGKQIAARPFMRPALDDNEQKIIDMVGKEIAAGLIEKQTQMDTRAAKASARAARASARYSRITARNARRAARIAKGKLSSLRKGRGAA